MLVKLQNIGSSGSTSYEVVGITKSGGSTTLSIPTTKKADNFTFSYPNSGTDSTIYAYNKDTNTLEYWTKEGHNTSYDISMTATFNENSIDLPAFNVSSGAKNCVVTVIYAE